MNELKELSPISSDLIRALEESISSLDCGSKNDIEPDTVSIRLDATEADELGTLILGYRETLLSQVEAYEDRLQKAETHDAYKMIEYRMNVVSERAALLNRTATLIFQTLDAAKGGSR
jgi:hypothetical protein